MQNHCYRTILYVMILSLTSCKGQVESIRLPRHVNDTAGIDLSAKYECTTKEWPIPYSYANSVCWDTILVTFDGAEYKVMLDIYMRDAYPVDIYISIETDDGDYDKYLKAYYSHLEIMKWKVPNILHLKPRSHDNLDRYRSPSLRLDTVDIYSPNREFIVNYYHYREGSDGRGRNINRWHDEITLYCFRRR